MYAFYNTESNRGTRFMYKYKVFKNMSYFKTPFYSAPCFN